MATFAAPIPHRPVLALLDGILQAWSRPRPDRDCEPLQHQLARGQLVRIQFPQGRTVQCIEGDVWLTFDHSPVEVVLGAGERWTCRGPERLVVMALSDGRIELR